MQELTPEGRRQIEEIAQRFGTSTDAAMTLLHALVAGGGTMAQFSHPDLGGMGQWSQGGMTMVGDMFNNGLKAKVDGLCAALSGLLAAQTNWRQPANAGGMAEVSLFVPALAGGYASWWGADLGHAASTGAQNDIRYAYFPASRRLAIEIGGQVTIYDTGDHQIGGVSQQQSGYGTLTFSSQYGLVRVSDLPVVPNGPSQTEQTPPEPIWPEREEAALITPAQPPPARPAPAPDADPSQDIIMLIERLAALREKNILTEDEFAAKKTELLARL